jgi:hypothetical protein
VAEVEQRMEKVRIGGRVLARVLFGHAFRFLRVSTIAAQSFRPRLQKP